MKKLLIILAGIAVLMFCEYRYIMTSMQVYYADDGFVMIDVLGQTDSYYAEPIFVEE